MAEILDAIKNRCSIRRFRPEQITQAELESIIEAGRMAPSGMNLRSNKIYVIRDEDIMQRINDTLLGAVKRGNVDGIPADSPMADNEQFQVCYKAPTFLITTHKNDSVNLFADAGCMIENMMLQATAMGIGSCWINTVRRAQNDPQVIAMLRDFGMAEDEVVTGGLALGYPDGKTEIRRKTDGNEVVYVK